MALTRDFGGKFETKLHGNLGSFDVSLNGSEVDDFDIGIGDVALENEVVVGRAVNGFDFGAKNKAREVGFAFVATREVDAVVLKINGAKIVAKAREVLLEGIATFEADFEADEFHGG